MHSWIDSLHGYIFGNYGHLLTREERCGWGYFNSTAQKESWRNDELLSKLDSGGKMAHACEEDAEKCREAASLDPVIKKLIDEYPKQFFVSVAHRILRDHPGEVRLNLCPKCLNLTRTPQAKLCLRCGHSWHLKIVRP